MKKPTLFGIVFIAALTMFSMVFAQTVFAGKHTTNTVATTTHTITIVNNSDTPITPNNNSNNLAVYDNYNSACLPPGATCGQVDLNPPSQIAAHSSAVLQMVAPTGCEVSAWESYWTLDLNGKNGTIHCSMSPINICNSVAQNYSCTISQSNVDAIKGNSNTSVAVSQTQ